MLHNLPLLCPVIWSHTEAGNGLQQAQDFLSAVAEAAEDAAKAAAIAQEEEQHVAEVAAETQQLASQTKTKLEAAMPALLAAEAALKALSKSDIGEIKAMTKPPPAVLLTMEVQASLMLPGQGQAV